MRDHHRFWLRLAAAILAAEGILTLMYGGFLPAPILPEIGVSVPILGRLTVFWSVVAGAYLVAAGGVVSRRRWGRTLAAIVAVVLLTSSGASLVAAMTHADLVSALGGFVGIGLAVTVLYAVLRNGLRLPSGADHGRSRESPPTRPRLRTGRSAPLGGWDAHRASGGRSPLARCLTAAYGDRRREALTRGPNPGRRDRAEPLARPTCSRVPGGSVMVRHMVRAVVKSGHWDEFIAADKAWQETATRVGLPAYRTYSSNWGTFNEAFSEAEYESSADIEARFAAADKDPGYDAATKAWLSHVVDGESRDYVLSEVVE